MVFYVVIATTLLFSPSLAATFLGVGRTDDDSMLISAKDCFGGGCVGLQLKS